MSTSTNGNVYGSPASARSVPAYASYAELLRDYESETILRVKAYLDFVSDKGAAAEDAALRREARRFELAEMVRRRKARAAATTIDLPLLRLSRDLGLSELEETLLAYLLFMREGVRLPGMLEELRVPQGGWNRVRVALAIAAGDPGACYASRDALSAGAPLIATGFLAELSLERTDSLSDAQLSLTLECVAALLADEATLSHLRKGILVERPEERLDELVLLPAVRETLERIANHHDAYLAARARAGLDEMVRYGSGTVILLEGLPGTGKTLTARALAGTMGVPLVMVEALLSPGYGQNQDDLLSVALMEARRLGAILFLDEFDEIAGEAGSAKERRFLLLLERATSIVVLATNRPRVVSPALERRILHKLQFTVPDEAMRRDIWRRHLPPEASSELVADLASRHWLSGGYIKNAVLAAMQASAGDEDADARLAADLRASARVQLRRFEETFEGAARFLDTSVAPELPDELAASGIDEVAALLPSLIGARAAGVPERIGIVAAQEKTIYRAARHLARVAGLHLVHLRAERSLPDISEEDYFSHVASLAAAAPGQLAALVLVGEPHVEPNELSRYLAALRRGPALVVLGTIEPELLRDPERLGLTLMVRGRPAPKLRGRLSLEQAAVASGLSFGVVDWDRVLLDARAGAASAAALCRVAHALSRVRGGDRIETEDLVRAARLQGGGMGSGPLFGRSE